MRRLVVHEFITLDGRIQAPDGAVEDIDDGFPTAAGHSGTTTAGSG
jgi:hypothetical protein